MTKAIETPANRTFEGDLKQDSRVQAYGGLHSVNSVQQCGERYSTYAVVLSALLHTGVCSHRAIMWMGEVGKSKAAVRQTLHRMKRSGLISIGKESDEKVVAMTKKKNIRTNDELALEKIKLILRDDCKRYYEECTGRYKLSGRHSAILRLSRLYEIYTTAIGCESIEHAKFIKLN